MKLSSDDLILVWALTRDGTLNKAAARLGKDPSTVFRSIQRIEQSIGEAIFTRSQQGFSALPLALSLADSAQIIVDEISAANAAITDQPSGVSGQLKVTTTDVVFDYYIRPNLDDFHRRHPGIDLEFDLSNETAQLWSRDADIAVRPTSSPPQQMIGQRLGSIGHGVAVSDLYLEEMSRQGLGVENAKWLLPGGDISTHPTLEWFRKNIDHSGPKITVSSMATLIKVLESGLGIGVVPKIPFINRITYLDFEIPYSSEIWVLYHPTNKQKDKLRTFVRFMRQVASQSGLADEDR